jgi:hypothetical protein
MKHFKINLFILTTLTLLVITEKVPERELYAAENVYSRIELHPNLVQKNDLDLFDISNTMYKFIDQNNLKLVSQGHGSDTLDYEVNTPSDRKLNILVQNNSDNFNINFSQDDLGIARSLNVKKRYYSLNEIQHFLDTNYNSLKSDLGTVKQERKLQGILNWQTPQWLELYKKIQPSDLTFSENVDHVEAKDNESKVLFDIKIETVNEDKFIKIYNDHKNEYEDNHARYERKIVQTDNEEKIQDYLTTTFKEIREIADKTKHGQLSDLVPRLKQKFTDEGYVLEDVNKDRNFNIKKENEEVGTLIVYETDGQVIGVTIKINGSEYVLSIPKNENQWQKNLEEIKTYLDTIKTKPSPLNFKNSKEKFITYLTSNKQCTFVPTLEEDIIAIGSVKEEANCKLSGGHVVFEIFNTGYFQFLHFYYDSPLLTTEYMLGLDETTFQARTESVLNELIKQIDDVTAKQENSDGDVVIDLQKVKALFDEVVTNVECSEAAGDVVSCQYKSNKARAARITKLNGNKMIKVHLFNSINSDKNGSLASNPVYYLQITNGYDQLEDFKNTLNSFFKHHSSLL